MVKARRIAVMMQGQSGAVSLGHHLQLLNRSWFSCSRFGVIRRFESALSALQYIVHEHILSLFPIFGRVSIRVDGMAVSRIMLELVSLLIKYLGVDSFIPLYHRVDGETLLDVFMADSTVYFGKLTQGLYRFVDVVDQKSGPPVFRSLHGRSRGPSRSRAHQPHLPLPGTSPNRSGIVFKCSSARAWANNSFLPGTSTGPM